MVRISGMRRLGVAIALAAMVVSLLSATAAYGAVTRYDQAGNPSVAYAPVAWTVGSPLAGHYGGTVSFSGTTNATATFTFNGTGVSLICAKWVNRGVAAVSVDGGPVTLVDLYAPGNPLDTSTVSFQQNVYTRTGLANGTHTLVVRVNGTRNPASSGFIVPIDAFDVYTPSTITATAGAGGTISPSGATVVDHGASQTYTITPAVQTTPISEPVVTDVKVDGVSVGAVNSYTFTNVTGPHTIEATFGEVPVTGSSSSSVLGLVALLGTGIVGAGVAMGTARRSDR